MASFDMDSAYPMTPLEGNSFARQDSAGGRITLSEVVTLLNYAPVQRDALAALGISVENRRFAVHFSERGRAYADPDGDRTALDEEESSVEFQVDILLSDRVPIPLPLRVHLGGWVQEGVNFLGRIEVDGGYCIPLTGRGTAALEGRPNDAHAGFCVGGACAAFQERAALILAIALAAGAAPLDLRRLTDELVAVDARFHGRRAILEYSLHCCLTSEPKPYRLFLKDYLSESALPPPDPTMAPLVAGDSAARPGPAFFKKLSQKWSQEELAANFVPSSEALKIAPKAAAEDESSSSESGSESESDADSSRSPSVIVKDTPSESEESLSEEESPTKPLSIARSAKLAQLLAAERRANKSRQQALLAL